MRKPINVKRKLQLLSQSGIPALVTDIVRVADMVILEADERGSDMEYGVIASIVLQVLKKEYKEALQVEDIIPRQRDLCDLIEKLRTGEEAVWKNNSTV